MIFDMRIRHIILFILSGMTACVYAQSDVFNYHKSSIYSVLLKHDNLEYSDEIVEAFRAIPIPDKFNNHNLSKCEFKAAVLEDKGDVEESMRRFIDELLKQNAIGRRLVAKWFNQSKDGSFNVELILERGYYNVDATDIALANKSFKTQEGILYDAGEELIANTYVLVNDIQYSDKRKNREKRMSGAIALGAIPLVGAVAMPIAGVLANDYAGFNVTITSYLYRLEWTPEIANAFYTIYWTDVPNETKRQTFKKEKELFKLSYVGSQTVYESNVSIKGVNNRETQIRKVCTRAIDESIAKLQKKHNEFRVRTPLLSTMPVTASIGMREGVTSDSRYEVLEVFLDKKGKTQYKRIATIKPIKGKIWDNRYLAEFEDDNKESKLMATEFELVSGSISHPGVLIREINN